MAFQETGLAGAVTLVTAALVALTLGGATAQQGARPFERLTTPRIQPLEPSEWTGAHRGALGSFDQGDSTIDPFKICLRNVALCRSWVAWVSHLAYGSDLPLRDKALLELRTLYLCHNDYGWSEHSLSAVRRGVFTDEELLRIAEGPQAAGWSSFEAAVLRAADELHADQFIRDATWKTLAERYNEEQLIEVTFRVANYTMTAMWLNSVGVELPPDYLGLPK